MQGRVGGHQDVDIAAVRGIVAVVTDRRGLRDQIEGLEGLKLRQPLHVVRGARVQKRRVGSAFHVRVFPCRSPCHVHCDAWGSVAAHLALMQSINGMERNAEPHQTFLVRPRQSTAGAVATKRAAAVWIAEIDVQASVAVGLDHHHTVGADALLTVAQGGDFLRRPLGGQPPFLPAIDEHKIVACAFPFFELQRHGTKVVRSWQEVGRHAPIFGTCPNLRNRPHPQGCSRRTRRRALRGPCPTSSKSTLG